MSQGDAAAYVERLRSVLAPAVRLGCTADFEQESLPVDEVPGWFAAVGSGGEERVPQFARTGRGAYAEHTGGGRPWDLQDWLYRFDPDEDSRAGSGGTPRWPVRPVFMSGWTAGGSPSSDARICSGPHSMAGAVRVAGPTVQKAAVWSMERTSQPNP
ncbi:hypothetical protein SBADM41S_09472 [Streptomyces badius]